MLPDPVLTTDPALAPPATGDVVTFSPLLKLGEPEMSPVIEPSAFCFHRLSVGTPFGADGFVEAFSAVDFGAEPPPKNENPPDLTGAGVGSGVGLGAGFALPPIAAKILIVPPTLGTFTSFLGAGDGFAFGFEGLEPKILIVPLTLGTLTSFFGAAFGFASAFFGEPKRENVGLFLTTGAFTGAGAGAA